MRLKTNILANLAGQGWSMLLQLILVPLYLHLLGIEAYGLVSIYVMLSATVQIFDLGFAQTLNRELARWNGSRDDPGELRDLVFTIEAVYYLLIALIVCVLLLALPFIWSDALHARTVDKPTLLKAVGLMIAIIAMQWPVNLYQGGLMGLQQQLKANGIRIASSTFAGLGSLACLYFVSPTIVAFFSWQLLAAALTLATSAFLFRSQLPRTDRPSHFRVAILKRIGRFSVGLSGLTISAIVLTQMDKWFLATILPLELFGYFALAWTAANALSLLTAPVFGAIYPRFSGLVVRAEREPLTALYHTATQAIAACIVPAALLMSFFSYDVLFAWTGNRAVAQHAAPILKVLSIGTMLNSFVHMPYAWELAHGRTRVFLLTNWFAIPLAFPALWYLSTRWGGLGAAFIWVALNLSYFVFAVPRVHREFAPRDRMQWLMHDIAAPLILAAGTMVVYRMMVPDAQTRAWMAVELALGYVLGACAALYASRALHPVLRQSIPASWRTMRR